MPEVSNHAPTMDAESSMEVDGQVPPMTAILEQMMNDLKDNIYVPSLIHESHELTYFGKHEDLVAPSISLRSQFCRESCRDKLLSLCKRLGKLRDDAFTCERALVVGTEQGHSHS